MRQVPRTINEYTESITKRHYNPRKDFLEEFIESDLEACVVDHENNYSSAKTCSSSLREGIERFFKGQIECHLVDGEVWLIKTIAIQKVK
jgi:hypothetical protein